MIAIPVRTTVSVGITLAHVTVMALGMRGTTVQKVGNDNDNDNEEFIGSKIVIEFQDIDI